LAAICREIQFSIQRRIVEKLLKLVFVNSFGDLGVD
jgi:hypothetical protein